MTLVTIIQARMGSQRFPGKTLEKIGDRTILEWVLHRLSQCEEDLGHLLVATGARGGDNPIAELCERRGVESFRGSELDVLNRFHQASLRYNATEILRVTADCPLLDPRLVDQLLRHHYGPYEHADITRISDERPKGIGEEEVINANALHGIAAQAIEHHDREHVTTFAEHKQAFVIVYLPTEDVLFDHQNLRLVVDYQEDLDMMRRLFRLTTGRLFELSSGEIIEAALADQHAHA